VIGGLITSTALTLVVVPAVFTVIDDLERRAGPWFKRVLTTKGDEGTAPAAAEGSKQGA
jgi:HAE1 family hydrophobic/amphiphilic exporter-1